VIFCIFIIASTSQIANIIGLIDLVGWAAIYQQFRMTKLENLLFILLFDVVDSMSCRGDCSDSIFVSFLYLCYSSYLHLLAVYLYDLSVTTSK
jgi:hypothetical protein